jgi:hypothetical protein
MAKRRTSGDNVPRVARQRGDELGFGGWVGQRKRSVASMTALAVASSAIAVLAVTSEGYSATRVDINDGGVWVTKPGTLGRLNFQLKMLDASMAPVAADLDVVQDGATVFRTDSENVVTQINSARVEQGARLELPAGFTFDQRGGGAVILDTKTGKAWIRPVNEILAVDLEAEKDKPDLTAGPGAKAVVGADGVVHVLSVKTDDVTSVPVTASGLGERIVAPLGQDVTTASITAVGGVPVVLDEEKSSLILPGGRVVALEGAVGPRLQQPGWGAASVVVAADGKVIEVALETGDTTLTQTVPGTEAVAPARVGSCLYAAWNVTPTLVISCNGKVTENKAVDGDGTKADLRIRVNRSYVALNDQTSGKVWVMDQKLIPAKDNWEESQPAKKPDTTQTTSDPGTEQVVQAVDRQEKNRPPVASPDDFGARPNRATILRVLDNDVDPDGDVLVISSVETIPAGMGRLEVINNGQALQFTPDPSAAGSRVSFRYGIDDGRGGEAKSSVSIDVRTPQDQNRPPEPIAGRTSSTVVETGRSVTYNVLGDWRDPDGDPLQLTGAESNDSTDTVRFSPDGFVTVIAGPQVGKRIVTIAVGDGDLKTPGKLSVTVRPPGPLDPSARPDHYVATSGQQLLLRPLLNDNDPNGDEIRLISIERRNDAGLTVQEDVRSGTVLFKADQPGAYTFLYYISGGAKPVPGVIRVDVQAKAENRPPVAVLDMAALSPDLTALVDVLANDYDPDGDVLVVTGVSAPAGLSVSVREHRVVQIRASKVPESDLVVTYTVSDGNSEPVQGTIVVRAPSFGSGKNQPPVANPDEAVVRAGDVVTVRVMNNDSDPDGDRLTLQPALTGLTPADGLGFVAGDTVRFQAPADAKVVQIVYSISDGKDVSSSRLTIRVRKADAKDNQPPLPEPIESRVVSGPNDHVVIPVPLDGIDPDGDSVQLIGIDLPAASLGKAEVRDQTLVYTPRENAAGTDTFGYKVRDTYGATAIGLVRVGVVDPTAANQDPTPVDDFVAATPAKKVTMDVLANDSDPDGQQPRLYTGTDHPVIEPQPGVDAKVVGSRIQVTVPADGKTAGLVYWVEDGSGGEASATLTVVGSSKIVNLPPLPKDDYAPQPAEKESSVTVDVLANDEDPDGPATSLKVTRVLPDAVTANATVRADGKAVTAQLTDRPRVIPYEITDGQATAIAFLFIPAKSVNRPPVLRNGARLEVQSGDGPVTFDISTYVEDPEGDSVRLGANDKVKADTLGDAAASSPTEITYTPASKASGDGTISFEVIDGATIQDSVNVVFLTLPVTVKASANNPPKVRAGSMTVAQGEAPKTLDVGTLVTDDPGDTFTVGDLTTNGTGVTAQLNGKVISAQAAADAPKGSTAKLTFTVTDAGGESAPGEVIVTVSGSTKPLARLADRTFDQALAGKPVTVTVSDQTSFNPFPKTPLRIVGASAVAGPAAVTFDAASVTVTPSADFHGQVSVLYKVQDETGDPDRVVEGRIVLTVQSVPDKPSAPARVSSGDSVAVISWPAPAANGSQITSYKVAWTGGSKDCGNATECQITGLKNATPYRFSVQAINGVGPGPISDLSDPIKPDVAPAGAPMPTVARPDTTDGGVLDIAWGSFDNKGSAITGCALSNGIQETAVPCDAGTGSGTFKWTGLTNGQSYAFRIRATNEAGPSDWSAPSDPGLGIPAGRPRAPGAPTGANAGGDVGKQVAVTWPAADGNGAAISEYTLTISRNGATEKTQVFPGGTLSTTVDVQANGASYTFTVRARNAVGESTDSPASAPVVPFGAPFQIASVTALAGDQSMTLTFADPNDNGQALVRREAQRNDGAIIDLAGGNTIPGLVNGTSYTFAVRACNSLCGPWSAPSNADIPYGPPGTPTVGAAVVSGTQVNVSWNAPAPNGRDIVRVQVSINGGGFTDQAPNGSTVVTVAGGQTVTIVARAVDSVGQTGPTSAQASATTPPPTASAGNGGAFACPPTVNPGTCYHVNVGVGNFSPNTAYNVEFWSNEAGTGIWLQRSITTDGAGNYSGNPGGAFYGFCGSQVWVVVGGVTSNQVQFC